MKRLTEEDYANAAKEIGCEIATIKAVAEVESAGDGYDEQARIKLRFEGHKFMKFTGGKYNKSHPDLSYPFSQMNQHPHGYAVFNQAFELDPNAALLSTSWGKFQPMGFTHDEAGFDNAAEYVDFLRESEGNQLLAFVRLVKHRSLDDELRRKDFAGFAKNYNGASYKVNRYDAKMAAAYRRHKNSPAVPHEPDENNEVQIESPTALPNTATGEQHTEQTTVTETKQETVQTDGTTSVISTVKETAQTVNNAVIELKKESPSLFTKLLTGLLTLLGAVLSFARDHYVLIIVGVLIIGALLLWHFSSERALKRDLEKMKSAADKDKNTVDLVQK